MPEITIVVPIYNVEKYLEKCIHSILNQTFKDFELILVDDGSPDLCGIICDEYEKKDERIIVIHQRNQGVSSARNAGIKIAKGKYIIFLDSDDFIEENMFETMLNTAKEKDVDVVICAVNYCQDDGSIIRSDLINEEYYDNIKLLKDIFKKPNTIGGGTWNKLFRLNDERVYFEENLQFCEDWNYLFDALSICTSGYQIPDVLYNIVEREGSATRNNRIDSFYKVILGFKSLLIKVRKKNAGLESDATDKFLDSCIRYIKLMDVEAKKLNVNISKQKFFVRWYMFQTIIYAIFKRTLTKSQTCGYFMEMLKL